MTLSQLSQKMMQLRLFNDTITPYGKIKQRELSIFEFIRKNKQVGNAEIMEYLASVSFSASRITVIRSVSALIKAGLIERRGEGRSVYYEEKLTSPFLAYFDTEEYFKKSPDERNVAFERFNFGIFDNLAEIFSKSELEELKNLNDGYAERIKKLPQAIIKKNLKD